MSWRVLADRLAGHAIDAVQDAYLASPVFGVTTHALPAQTGYATRFVVPENFEVSHVRFRTQGVDAADPAVQVGIYDGTSGLLLASSASTAGQLNANGVKDVALSAALPLEPGRPYYAALAADAVVGAPTVQGCSISNAGFATFFGAGVGDAICGQLPVDSFPLPADLTTLVPTGATSFPILAVVKRV